jgi:putative membrane protein
LGILIRFAVTFVAVFVTTQILPGALRFDGIGQIALFAAVLALINAFVRPIVMMLTCPIQMMTLGLASLLVNALLFLGAAALTGVETGGFVTVFIAALIVSLISWGISIFVKT